MNAQAWFNKTLDAAAKAYGAKTVAERQRHGRDAIDAALAAASLGHPEAFLTIGIYYKHGQFGILPVRMDLAEHWLRLAAARDSGGMFALGTLLIERDRKVEGRKWLRAALAHGEGGAACHLGREIEARSPSRALSVYRIGAALGDPFAAVCAGRVLEARKTRRALLQAEAMYEQAAKKEFPDADKDLERVRRLLSSAGPRPSRSQARHPSRVKKRRHPGS